jgi:hypothetical protein
MSTENSVTTENANANGQTTVNAENQGDLKSQLARLEQTNQRLLKESQEHKLKAQKVLEEREQFEQDRLKKEGDLDGYAKRIAEENNKLKSELSGIRSKVLKANIKTKVSKFAGEVHDLDDLLNQSQFKDILQRGINQDDLDVDEAAAQEYVQAVLKNKPWLRKPVGGMGVNTTKPGMNSAASVTGGPKNLSEMSTKDLIELAKQTAQKGA